MMCYNFTSAPLFDMCPFQLRLLCSANKSNLAQNITVNNKQSTHQSSYVSSGAGPEKSILCFYWQEQPVLFKAGRTMINAWRGAQREGRENMWGKKETEKESKREETSMRGSYCLNRHSGDQWDERRSFGWGKTHNVHLIHLTTNIERVLYQR